VENLLPVTLGNIVGGVVFVACAYWYVHSGGDRDPSQQSKRPAGRVD
jgi:formate/nitrite transporter FocA (FNT family)